MPKDPTNGLNPWGCHFTAEPPFLFHTGILRVSRQVNQEAKRVLYNDSKSPWKIKVNSTTNKMMSGRVLDALDLLPCMMTSTNIHFNFYFFAPVEGSEDYQNLQEIRPGIDYICKTLSTVPISRNIGVFWWDFEVDWEWETKRSCLDPMAILSKRSFFHVMGIGLQDVLYEIDPKDASNVRECLDRCSKMSGRIIEWDPPASQWKLRARPPTRKTPVYQYRHIEFSGP